ncbi:hypothetical protein LOTGIDRAFT_68264, partial [Lottia gigantea]
RAMLVKISNKLEPPELKTLIYYTQIKRKLAETIQNATDLFKILEERQDLKPNDLRYFRQIIVDTLDTRKDLLKIIDDYVRDNEIGGRPDTESSDYLGGLQEEKDFLAKNYGKGWKFFIRRLSLSEGDIEHIEAKNKGNQKEAINECIQFWLNQQQDNASREKIIRAL